MLFTYIKSSKIFLRYSTSKSEATLGSLWEAQTKTAKKDFFTKNLSFPMFFEINTSTFRKCSVQYLEKLSERISIN